MEQNEQRLNDPTLFPSGKAKAKDDAAVASVMQDHGFDDPMAKLLNMVPAIQARGSFSDKPVSQGTKKTPSKKKQETNQSEPSDANKKEVDAALLKKLKTKTFKQAAEERILGNSKRVNDMVDKAAATLGKQMNQAADKLSAGVKDTPQVRIAMMNKIVQFETLLGCTRINKGLNAMTSPIEQLCAELASHQNECAQRRSHGTAFDIPQYIVTLVEQNWSWLNKKLPPPFRVLDISGAEKIYKQELDTNPRFRDLLTELCIMYGDYVRVHPVIEFGGMLVSNVFLKAVQENAKKGAVSSSAVKTQLSKASQDL